MLRPRFVVEENCQLSTSATWSHVPMGGLVKKFTFCTREHSPEQKKRDRSRARSCSSPNRPEQFLSLSASPYLGVVGQHVVPQDGCPGIRHLADVRDDNHRQ